MYKKLNIAVFLISLLVCLSACGGKQYEIDLLAPDHAVSDGEADPAESLGIDGEDVTVEERASHGNPDSLNQTVVGGMGADADDGATYFVHICGAVVKPGVYEVAAGSRVFELLELAGGFSDEAATDAVNLAMAVSDGSQIQIPTIEQAAEQGEQPWVTYAGGGSGDTTSVNGASSTLTGLVNINTASSAELMTLPGIGQAKADSIIAYRSEKGKFTRIEDIMQITGIKEGVFEKIKDRICV